MSESVYPVANKPVTPLNTPLNNQPYLNNFDKDFYF